MFWLFSLLTTAGIVLGTPHVFQAAIDTTATPSTASDVSRWTGASASIAAALTVGGLGGLLALAFDPPDTIALVVALCLGLAGSAMHPELLAALRRR